MKSLPSPTMIAGLTRGWLSALAAGVALWPPRAVGGATHNGLPTNANAATAQLVLSLLADHDLMLTGLERLLPSNNFAFPARELIGLGGFNEGFRTAEDRELCRRWTAAGFELGRVAGAIVEHDARMNLGSFVGKFFNYGRGAAKFHGSGAGPSLRESLRFHFRLPILVIPELRRRSIPRRVAIVALLILWEFANLAGYLAERMEPAVDARSARSI